MHCIPEEPIFKDGQLAEKTVWDALRSQLPDDVVLAHSVQVRHGRAEHEIDVLVLWPGVGLAAIEVKGGRISVDHGQWYQSDRNGKHKIESPIAQSQGSQHAFKGWVKDQIGSPLVSRFAYMAAFPYSDVPHDWEMAGVPRPLILDQDDLTDCRERLRAAIETQTQGGSPLAPKYAQRIIPLLSGDLEPSSDPSLGADELEDLQEHLTERQKVLLDCSRSIPRARFVGGAGSGKTWLAVEKAKRLAKEGKRVGLFCYNRGLAEHLRRQVAGWRQAKPVYVGFAPRGGDGLPVRLVPSSTDDAIDVAGDCVDALIDEGWANNQIAFLTTKNRHSIHKEFENDPVGYWQTFHDDDGEFYGHVLGFKGLERSVVILCVNGFKDMGRAAELLYVGLSRARCLLVVVGDPDLIAEAGGPELARAMSSAQHWQPDLAAQSA